MRHFLSEDLNPDHHEEFCCNLYLLICGISSALYRFHGPFPLEPESLPQSSHPTPLRRLEVVMPNVFEKLDLNGHGIALHGLTRKQLVDLTSCAGYSVMFFSTYRYPNVAGLLHYSFFKGLLQDPHKSTYWREIILAWEVVKPEILKVRRFGSKFELLDFTDEFRSLIFNNHANSK